MDHKPSEVTEQESIMRSSRRSTVNGSRKSIRKSEYETPSGEDAPWHNAEETPGGEPRAGDCQGCAII